MKQRKERMKRQKTDPDQREVHGPADSLTAAATCSPLVHTLPPDRYSVKSAKNKQQQKSPLPGASGWETE